MPIYSRADILTIVLGTDLIASIIAIKVYSRDAEPPPQHLCALSIEAHSI